MKIYLVTIASKSGYHVEEVIASSSQEARQLLDSDYPGIMSQIIRVEVAS